MKHISEIKDKNKSDIIYLLYTKQNLSKKRIALELGLSSSVLTKLCNELLEEGIIIETSPIESLKAGRKEIGLSINSFFKYCFGITLNHRKTSILLVDMNMKVIYETDFATSMNALKHLDTIINSLSKIIIKYGLSEASILGIGISIKGITDGVHSLSGIWNSSVNIKEYIHEKTKIPVVVDNGIRCSAMLEQFSTPDNNYLFIKYMEPGIGGAIVKHGRVLRGETYSIMDFGHEIVKPDGDYCPICKRRGCLESVISIEHSLQFAKQHFNRTESPILLEICHKNANSITISKLIEAVDKGSIICNQLFKQNATYFAMALINTVAIMDITKIIIIGDLFSSDRFREYLRSALIDYQLAPLYDNIEFHIHQNELLSPIALALNEFLFKSFDK